MTKIENTELEYNDHECVGLDRFLGKSTETKDEWAQRIWDGCRRQSEGEDISRVYISDPKQTWQDRAKSLWENKKRKRCDALCFEFGEKQPSKEALMRIKKDPKYKTRDQMSASEEENG